MSKFVFIGLGNPGEEYKNSRHNVGRLALQELVAQAGKKSEMIFNDWKADKKTQALKNTGDSGAIKISLFLPETFMNNSGQTAKAVVANAKQAKNLVVLHDDVDLPLGYFKICFNRGSGGHKGLESIIHALRTKEFSRIRIGISPTTPSGKMKKPRADEVVDFVIGNFKSTEKEILKKVFKKINQALTAIATVGLEQAMNEFNQKN